MANAMAVQLEALRPSSVATSSPAADDAAGKSSMVHPATRDATARLFFEPPSTPTPASAHAATQSCLTTEVCFGARNLLETAKYVSPMDTTTGCRCGEQNAALKSRAFGPRAAAEARRAEAVAAKRLAQRFVLGVRSGTVWRSTIERNCRYFSFRASVSRLGFAPRVLRLLHL